MSEADKIIENLKKSGRKVEEFYTGNKTSDKNVANDSVIAHKFAVMQQQINEKDKRIQELESLKEVLFNNYIEQKQQKDKRIQELEEENTKYKNSFNQQVEILKDTIKKLNESIPKQAIIDLIKNETIDISGFECIAVEDLEKLLEDK